MNFYSESLSNIINLVGPNLRRIDLSRDLDLNLIPSLTDDSCRVGSDQMFKLITPMPLVTHMRLALPASQWVNSWKCALIATPALQELRVGTLGAFDRIPTLEGYTPTDSPCLPSLDLLSIEQMCTALEPAITNLIKSSDCHIVRLWLDDPEGSWKSSKEFKEFLVEWEDRLDLKIGLPPADQEEEDWLEGKEMKGEDMMDQDRTMELWMSVLISCFPTVSLIIVLFTSKHVAGPMKLW